MKRFIPVFLSVILIISFSACSKKADAVDLNRLYSVTAEISYNGFNSTASLSRLGNGAWDINFTAPETISGMNITYVNETAEVTYKGLSFSIPKEEVPLSSIGEILTKVLDNAATASDTQYTEKNDKIKVKGETAGNKYELTVDKKSGAILNLEIEAIKLDASFTEFSLMGQ